MIGKKPRFLLLRVRVRFLLLRVRSHDRKKTRFSLLRVRVRGLGFCYLYLVFQNNSRKNPYFTWVRTERHLPMPVSHGKYLACKSEQLFFFGKILPKGLVHGFFSGNFFFVLDRLGLGLD